MSVYMKKIVSLFIVLAMVLSANGATKRTSYVSQPTFKSMKQELPASAISRLELAKDGQRVARPTTAIRKATSDEKITITANNLTFDYCGGYFPYVYGGTDEYTVVAFFWGDETFGQYQNNDEDLEITIYEGPDDKAGIALNYTQAGYQKEDRGTLFWAIGTGEDGKNYEITLTFFAPEEAKDTIRHSFTTAEADAYPEYGGYYIAYAADATFECKLVFDGIIPTNPKAALDEAYTWVQTIDGTDTTYVGAPFIADVVITETPTSYTFKLNYFASDSNLYILTLPVAKIAPVDTVVYTFAADRTVSVLYYGETGDYYIKAKDANAIVTLDIYSDDNFAGIWKAADGVLDFTYTNARVIAGGDTTTLAYRDVEVIAIENKDYYAITANFFAKTDNMVYSFKTNYVKPVAKDTSEYTLPEYTFDDYRDWDGSFDIIAAPADSSIVFHLEFLSEEVAGTYTEKNMSGDYTWIQVGENIFTVVKEQIVVTGDEDELLAVGQLLVSNNTLYKLTIGKQQSAIERVEGVKDIQPMKVIRGGQVLILKDGQYYNLLGTKID